MENYNSNFYIPHNQIDFPSIDDPFYKYQNNGYMMDYSSLHQQNFHKKYIPNQVTPYWPKEPIIRKSSACQTPIVTLDDYPGEFNFQFSLPVNECFRTNLMYSKKLLKVYIKMGHVLPMRFSWSSFHGDFWLRTTMVFREDHDRSIPVQRCYAHMASDLPYNQNINASQLQHVFRTGNVRSYYHCNNGILSTLTPLNNPVIGLKDVPIDFLFYCKNSCPTGINRRPTMMVFTLESQTGQVLGRRSLQVQICSCPKRDKERDENDLQNPKAKRSQEKKSISNPPPVPPPEEDTESSIEEDQNVYSLKLDVLGEENYKAVLKYAYDIMAGYAVRTGNFEILKKCSKELHLCF